MKKALPAAFVYVGAGAHASAYTHKGRDVQPFSIIKMNEGTQERENKKEKKRMQQHKAVA